MADGQGDAPKNQISGPPENGGADAPPRTYDELPGAYRVALVLAASLVILALSVGIRQTFGLFMRPISSELGWGREVLSLAFAVQALIIGMFAPVAGALSDKWGPARVIAGGGLLYGLGLFLMSQSTSPLGMLLSGGVIVGIGASACGFPMVLSIIGRIVAPERRGMWLGTATAIATFGQLSLVPLSQQMLSNFGWVIGLIVLAALAAMILPMGAAISLAKLPALTNQAGQNLGDALREARRHSGYCLLTVGFFVCGFQVLFIAAHLPAYLVDKGFSPSLAATALITIAGFNAVGSWAAGYLGDRWRKKYLLSWLYTLRSVAIFLFITVPTSEVSVLIFSAVIGLLWLGTVPLTSGIIAQIFGTRYMATLYGITFFSHQIGSFLGVWLGGRVFDTTGSYTIIWWISIALGLITALVHLPIKDKPLARLSAAE